MVQLNLRFSFLSLALFIVLILFIRAQTHDDSELRQTLLPEGCPAPCFMGIRPGVTTTKEALTLLQAHAWVADVVTTNPQKSGQIWWRWNTNAPDFLRSIPTNPKFPVNGEVESSNEIVTNILFTPGLTLGDIVLARGLPPASQLIFGGVIFTPNKSVSAIIALEYQSDGFWVSGTARCSYTADLWHIPAQIRITNEFNGISLGTVRPIDRSTFLNSIRRTSNLMCGL